MGALVRFTTRLTTINANLVRPSGIGLIEQLVTDQRQNKYA
jgi:hypothetical protein